MSFYLGYLGLEGSSGLKKEKTSVTSVMSFYLSYLGLGGSLGVQKYYICYLGYVILPRLPRFGG